MNIALLTLILAVGWAAATGDFSLPNLLAGAVAGGLGLFFIRDHLRGRGAMHRFLRMLSLAGLFIAELLLSALRVALLVLRPDMRSHLSPGFVAFPLKLTRDSHITLLANLITLTPGTLSVDVSEDRKVLYVHALRMGDREALVREIAEGFEKKIIEAFG